MPEYSDNLADLLAPERRAVLREIFEVYRYTLVSARFFRNRAPWRLKGRVCPDHFFLFPTVGRLRVALEGECYELTAGEFLMLPEGVWHQLQIGEGCRHLHQISIHAHIHDPWGRPFLERSRTTRGKLMHGGHDLEALQWLVHLKHHQVEAAAQSFGEGFLKQLLAFQLGIGAEILPMGEETKRDARIAQALRRMEADFGSSALNVESLAQEAGITPTHFRKLFQRDVGQKPSEFLARLRLREARLRLSQTALSIKEVAAACGFGSDHYFHLTFRRAYACTPSEYRRRAMSEL